MSNTVSHAELYLILSLIILAGVSVVGGILPQRPIKVSHRNAVPVRSSATKLHVLILDNAMLHKTLRTRELIEAKDAHLLFLPLYSPDYNPIEHDLVSNIKRRREYNPDLTLQEIIQEYANV